MPDFVVAYASVKVTAPKSQSGTRLPSLSKSSTIHSAFSSQSAYDDVSDFETVVPVVKFSMTALPDVVEEVVTVSLMVSPALMVIPLKS